ncbi:hypothetical protein WJX73_003648 [Symbiochloris irregularis]|uniref:Polymerase nucleotidyl transferase domain-containing protein n=1 Tax=Symbiochloris irregularis TaxID=706552 RepID=A0AAW1PBV2_9CHLO
MARSTGQSSPATSPAEQQLDAGNSDDKVSATSVQEARVDQLIEKIMPNRTTADRRHALSETVQGWITEAFKPRNVVQAYIYGSVPLKTFLPDGDIDLAVFIKEGPRLRQDEWLATLAKHLEQKQSRDRGRPGPKIKDVQAIAEAEVKLCKCLVDNIVVDISFETVGGLSALCFLESIDRKIGHNHLFKRSIILVKGWCYYESRLLGAHHGLLSTYALETMVLYLLNTYHFELDHPLKVLHKFLQVFAAFDWDNYVLSMRGACPLADLPGNLVAEPPPTGRSLLLEEGYLQRLIEKVAPPSIDRPFGARFLNIQDPVVPRNNIGRSVSKASFFRLRKAFRHGAEQLSRAIELGGRDVRSGDMLARANEAAGMACLDAIDRFFRSTWNAQRPNLEPHILQQSQQQLQQPADTSRRWQNDQYASANGDRAAAPAASGPATAVEGPRANGSASAPMLVPVTMYAMGPYRDMDFYTLPPSALVPYPTIPIGRLRSSSFSLSNHTRLCLPLLLLRLHSRALTNRGQGSRPSSPAPSTASSSSAPPRPAGGAVAGPDEERGEAATAAPPPSRPSSASSMERASTPPPAPPGNTGTPAPPSSRG